MADVSTSLAAKTLDLNVNELEMMLKTPECFYQHSVLKMSFFPCEKVVRLDSEEKTFPGSMNMVHTFLLKYVVM